MTYGSIIAIVCALFVIFFITYMEKNNITYMEKNNKKKK
ncbi:TPA: erm Leader peptide [Staphylococcus aureus]|nr:erm Leader peptide [Staphylococcus aureus]WOL34636.1 erm Leader peptide [Staphylococcus aureus]HDL0563654.1 erm Leader peptide [Staphylococcus aureus]HDL0566355.1 erm Leader peptide [Staphylococcus aureus]HDL0618258.1 erm Leader peptide [Staphylococcus aureus]HDL0637476.1 erm Leader peptide [Staphylococcus aureus]